MPSRDPKDLTPEMRERWERSARQWRDAHPSGPAVFLTQTLRTMAEQNALFAQGRTRPGKVVTNARGGQSLHNYGLAFDIAFKDDRGNVLWQNATLFRQFAVLAKANGLAWGGDWKGFKDLPHFEPPHFTYHDAIAGRHPQYPAMPAAAVPEAMPS